MTELRQREPRRRNPAYLAWLRRQGCSCGCGAPPRSDAAHIRSASIRHRKAYTGMAEKPSDHWAIPLNRSCHMRQHAHGDELGFWSEHRKDPFDLALRYNALYATETGRDAVADARVSKSRHRQKRAPSAPRRAPGPKQKIASRPKSWPKGRRLKSRGFPK